MFFKGSLSLFEGESGPRETAVVTEGDGDVKVILKNATVML